MVTSKVSIISRMTRLGYSAETSPFPSHHRAAGVDRWGRRPGSADTRERADSWGRAHLRTPNAATMGMLRVWWIIFLIHQTRSMPEARASVDWSFDVSAWTGSRSKRHGWLSQRRRPQLP